MIVFDAVLENGKRKESWLEDPLGLDSRHCCQYDPLSLILITCLHMIILLDDLYILTSLFLFAVLVASVVRTRMHDMESMMNQEQAPKQTHHITAAPSDVTVLPDSDREIAKELK
ncbi:unnamed protein product [Brassica oleracea var. botrytis]|uniref:(rape) hypothetical protein n=1 Tax=Brassica napus TaxID=3708 RepID=A0A816TYQ4_BRANA|nr:unnamed protein product [Brassica napus]